MARGGTAKLANIEPWIGWLSFGLPAPARGPSVAGSEGWVAESDRGGGNFRLFSTCRIEPRSDVVSLRLAGVVVKK